MTPSEARNKTKDRIWNVDIGEGGVVPVDQIALVLLTDIRDRLNAVPALLTEIKKLNETLSSPGLGNAWIAAYVNAVKDGKDGKDGK